MAAYSGFQFWAGVTRSTVYAPRVLQNRARGIASSMDGRGRALDNIFVERLSATAPSWCSVKHEDVYPKGYSSIPEL